MKPIACKRGRPGLWYGLAETKFQDDGVCLEKVASYRRFWCVRGLVPGTPLPSLPKRNKPPQKKGRSGSLYRRECFSFAGFSRPSLLRKKERGGRADAVLPFNEQAVMNKPATSHKQANPNPKPCSLTVTCCGSWHYGLLFGELSTYHRRWHTRPPEQPGCLWFLGWRVGNTGNYISAGIYPRISYWFRWREFTEAYCRWIKVGWYHENKW